MTDFATRSEERFAEHLDTLVLQYEYEPSGPDGSERRPDFLVHGPQGDIACEVTALTWISAPDEHDAAGPFDGYGSIRRKLREKHKQGRHLKGMTPYVVVLWFEPPSPAVELFVPGAMYGNVGISIPIDPSGEGVVEGSERTIFMGGGRLQRKRLTTISAVAVLSTVNPTTRVVEERIARRVDDDMELQDIGSIVVEEYGRGDHDPSAYLTRLDTFHNVHAAEPRLERGMLAGPRDREFDGENGYFVEVFRGDDFVE